MNAENYQLSSKNNDRFIKKSIKSEFDWQPN